MRRFILVGLALSAACGVYSILAYSAPVVPPTFDPVQSLPFDITSTDAMRPLRRGYQKALVNTNTDDRQVHVEWWAGALVNQPKPAGYVPADSEPDLFPLDTATNTFAVRYFPNAVCRVNDDTLLVSGVTKTGGRPVIEKWTFEYPLDLPYPITDIETGASVVGVVIPQRTIVDELFVGDAGSTKYIRSMSDLRRDGQDASEALVLWDDGEVAVIDLDGGQLFTLAGPQGGTYATIPELGSVRYTRIVPAERQDEGYVYRFFIVGPRGTSTVWPLLVLIDSDKNGSIDQHQVLDESGWVAGAWNDESTYVDLWLD